MELHTIWIFGVGIICFIAGMILELIVNAAEINTIKEELEYTKSKLKEKQMQTIEVIEINDNSKLNSETESLFEPW
jgi:hypothetical protein